MQRLSVVACILLAAGCAQRENIPTYPPMDAQQSLATIRQRSAQIQNVSGEGAITLTDPTGRSVRLDAAFVLAPPERARVRAWKFGQAVLDLTILPEGTWVYLPRAEDDHAEQLRAASGNTGRALRQWLGLLAGQLDTPQSSARVEGSRIIVTRPASDGMMLTAIVDRATLTPRRYALKDVAGRERFTLSLDHYRLLGPTVWPEHVEARSESGTIAIEMRDVELNDAAPGAFKPPARAVEVQ
jgi:outer membrane lipoprotein-sorting protein